MVETQVSVPQVRYLSPSDGVPTARWRIWICMATKMPSRWDAHLP